MKLMCMTMYCFAIIEDRALWMQKQAEYGVKDVWLVFYLSHKYCVLKREMSIPCTSLSCFYVLYNSVNSVSKSDDTKT